MKFFSIDSPLYKFMQRLWDVIKLNFMLLVCSLPVVTSGAAVTAGFYVALRMTEDTEGDIIKNFLTAFRDNIKQGIAMTFITLICAAAVWLDFAIYNMTEENSLPFLIIGVLTAYLFTFSFLYVFPLIARYDNTVFNSLRNSYRMGMKYFFRTLLLIVVIAAELAFFFWNSVTLFIGLLIGPACLICTISGTALYIFHEIEKVPGSTVPSKAELSENDDQQC